MPTPIEDIEYTGEPQPLVIPPEELPDGFNKVEYSIDGGETWTEDYTINDRLPYICDMGYPASCELLDGSILTVYYQPWPGEGHPSVLWTKWKLGDNSGGDEALEAYKKLEAEMAERRTWDDGGWN
jgi:hypothetical protein